jgi:ABC-type ATPase involved in cell division
MTSKPEPARTTVAAAAGIDELGAEARRARTSYGDGALIVCDRVVRIYSGDGIEVQALQGLDLVVGEGELTALVTARQRLAYRRSVVGFLWQQASRNLLPYLTGRQNVMMPMSFSRLGQRERERRAGELLQALGVAHCAGRTPDKMSGGEQQRTAIATALANQPRVLLADEPTGELDTATSLDVFAALQTANSELGATILVVTHDQAVSAQVRRTVAIRDGRTSSETLRHAAVGDEGDTTHHTVEYAVMDRAGRVQLPREMTEPLGMADRVRLEARADHIGVWPDVDAAGKSGPDEQR